MNIRIHISFFLLLLGFSIWTPVSFCQIRPIEFELAKDSLSQIDSPTHKVQKSIDYSFRLFMYGNRAGCKEILDDAWVLVERHEIEEYKVETLLNLGRVYSETGELSKGIAYLMQALPLISQETEHFRGKILSFLGYYHLKANNVDSLTKYFVLAEKWNEENEPYRNWVLYEQWHHFFINNDDLDQAESLIQKAYDITKPVGKRMDHGIVLHRLQQIASRKDDMTQYAKYVKEYYAMVDKDPEAKNKPMMHGFNLSPNLSADQKIHQFERLLRDGEIWEFTGSVAQIHTTLCELYLETNRPNSGLKHLLKIDTSGKKPRYKEDYLNLLTEVYIQKNDYKTAYEKLTEKLGISNEANKEEKLNQIRQLEAKYKNQQQQNEITLLKAQDELNSMKVQKAENRLNYAIGFSLILISLLGALVYYIIQNRKKTQMLADQNEIIANALQSKDILLREIHHRVKNNLQVISSLLNLQSNFISDDVALQAINEGKNRVNSMALIHQKLYQEKNLMGIQTDIYFNDLIESLTEAYNITENDIEMDITIDPIMLDVDTMIPLGLITNELVSNAFKHAFGNELNEHKKITVSLKQIESQLHLTVQDNGRGMNSNEFLSSQSFGNKLIQAFLQKLDAEINIENKAGTCIQFVINKYKIAA